MLSRHIIDVSFGDEEILKPFLRDIEGAGEWMWMWMGDDIDACLFVEGKNDDDRRGGRCIGEGEVEEKRAS